MPAQTVHEPVQVFSGKQTADNKSLISNIYTVVEGHKYDTKCLKYLFVAGEHCDHGTRVWAENQFQVPVLGEKLVLFSSYKTLIMSPNSS